MTAAESNPDQTPVEPASSQGAGAQHVGPDSSALQQRRKDWAQRGWPRAGFEAACQRLRTAITFYEEAGQEAEAARARRVHAAWLRLRQDARMASVAPTRWPRIARVIHARSISLLSRAWITKRRWEALRSLARLPEGRSAVHAALAVIEGRGPDVAPFMREKPLTQLVIEVATAGGMSARDLRRLLGK